MAPGSGSETLEMTSHQQKAEYDLSAAPVDVDTERNEHNGFKSTSADVANMLRMGKEQQLVRRFRVLSMASFVAVATATWEFALFNVTAALTNGGRPALIYGILWNVVGFCPIYLSMAELSSMAPIAGAQYHWVSEFSPESLQRSLSYLTGWTSTLAWQAGNAAGVFLVGSIVQILISLHNEAYTFPQWHTTLLAIAAVTVAYIGNTLGAKFLHMWQNVVFSLHVLVYLGILIPIWVNAPRAPSSNVWANFTFDGGWPSNGVAVLIGQQTAMFAQLGLDTQCITLTPSLAAHMSEEVKNASKAVPKAMIAIWLVNSVLAFTTFLTVAYHLPDINAGLNDPTLYPIIHILRQSMSKEWMTVVLTFVLCLLVCSNMTYLAAVTRDIWAFARDQGFPFSDWISRVDSKSHIPRNAISVTSAVSIALSLIYIGSPVAFYAMTSLLTVALLQCYCLSIGCILWRRIVRPETLPPATFPLGKMGVPINIAAVLYALFAFFWAFWPTFYDVTAKNFNWASAIFMGALVIAGIHFVFVARHKYFGPVAHVQGRNIRTKLK
ncbi:predicted protein [Uncinocarpus reesii 1704]|uniref:GABA permease n=1 Tax=Uncinocarpus reesii (strain UAMH 1704) TaxID=336963 RepID=C4JSV2_UNCRE|nr:uncharacterized protein UREG_05541 [Uncinocarpus reesii 1704]EEP80699.1 predicted protein [Uncinocarpus reesii 1704]